MPVEARMILKLLLQLLLPLAKGPALSHTLNLNTQMLTIHMPSGQQLDCFIFIVIPEEGRGLFAVRKIPQNPAKLAQT